MNAPNHINRFIDVENGVEAVINMTRFGSFMVTVRDTDVNLLVGQKILFTLSAAVAYAMACVTPPAAE